MNWLKTNGFNLSHLCNLPGLRRMAISIPLRAKPSMRPFTAWALSSKSKSCRNGRNRLRLRYDFCGMGNVRYSNPVENGLQFRTTLVMQGIAELDAILMEALKPKSKDRLRHLGHLRSFFKSVAAHA